jgi:hypothetical protein
MNHPVSVGNMGALLLLKFCLFTPCALDLTPNGWILVTINGGKAVKALGVKTGDFIRLWK